MVFNWSLSEWVALSESRVPCSTGVDVFGNIGRGPGKSGRRNAGLRVCQGVFAREGASSGKWGGGWYGVPSFLDVTPESLAQLQGRDLFPTPKGAWTGTGGGLLAPQLRCGSCTFTRYTQVNDDCPTTEGVLHPTSRVYLQWRGPWVRKLGWGGGSETGTDLRGSNGVSRVRRDICLFC